MTQEPRRDQFADIREAIKRRFYAECLKAFCSNDPSYAPELGNLTARGKTVVAAVSAYIAGRYGVAESIATASAGSMLVIFFRMAGSSVCEELLARNGQVTEIVKVSDASADVDPALLPAASQHFLINRDINL